MSRPRYETSADLSREDACAARVSSALSCEMVKLTGQYSRMDRLATWPRAKRRHAFVEIKCRKAMQGTYPTLMLSAAKWRDGVDMAEATGGDFIVVASYLDGDWLYSYHPSHVSQRRVWLEHGGRTRNTRDALDIEPVMHIASDLFLPLPTREDDRDSA